MTLDIEAIKARANKATAMGTLDARIASAMDVPVLIAALEASETARVKAEQEWDTCGGLAAQAVNDLKMAQKRITGLQAERDTLKEALNRQAMAWANVQELDLLPMGHRVTAVLLWQDCRRALGASK